MRDTVNILMIFIFLLLTLNLLSLAFLNWKGAPEYAYNYSYMTRYAYHPYVAFTSGQAPFDHSVTHFEKHSLAILGGSTAAGVGAKNFQGSFADVFKKNGFQQVVNYAFPGFVSNQENASYKNFVFPYEPSPQYLISLTSFNDAYFYLFKEAPVGNHEFSYAFEKIFRAGYPEPIDLMPRTMNWLKQRAFYAALFKLFLQKSVDEPIQLQTHFEDPYQPNSQAIPDQTIKKAAKNFVDNCLSTALMAKEKKSQYVIVLQPVYYYGGSLNKENNEWFKSPEEQQTWINLVASGKKAFDGFYALIIPELKSLERRGLIRLLDYRGLFAGAPPVYEDPVHFTDQGFILLADRLSQDLSK